MVFCLLFVCFCFGLFRFGFFVRFGVWGGYFGCFFVSIVFFLTLTGNIQMRQLIWPSVTSAAQPLAQAGTGRAGLALWSWGTEGQEGTLGWHFRMPMSISCSR